MEHGTRMQGRIALITGGAGGIGAATAELFCAQQAQVLLVDKDSAALVQQAAAIRRRIPGAAISVFVADITDTACAADAVAHAVKTLGALNVLVNNAAVRYLSLVADADPRQWEKVLAVNLLGALNMSKAALPELRKRNGESRKRNDELRKRKDELRTGNGELRTRKYELRTRNGASIVNVSSTYALVGRADFGAYDASKAALLSLTRTLAFEESEHGIRVNAVCPGGTLTPYTVGRAKERGLSESALRGQAKTDALLKRWGEASEIAYPILWLASDEASFVTGAILPVDGGTSIM